MDKLKIAVLEPEAFEKYPINSEIYDGISYLTPKRISTTTAIHGGTSMEYLIRGLRNGLTTQEIKDNVEIYLLPNNYIGMYWCQQNDVDILSMSTYDWNFLGCSDVDAFETNLAKNTLMFNSAGNHGNYNIESKRAETGSAIRDSWIVVGAIDSELNPQPYSSYGLGYVVCSAQDDLDKENIHDSGTSFSCPFIAGQMAVFQVKHMQTLRFKPTRNQSYEFLIDHCEDVYEIGNDLKTGEGVLRLPSKWIFKESIYKANNPTKTIRTYVDGELTDEITKHTYSETFSTSDICKKYPNIANEFGLSKDRTYVSIRDLSEDCNKSIMYNIETEEIHLSI